MKKKICRGANSAGLIYSWASDAPQCPLYRSWLKRSTYSHLIRSEHSATTCVSVQTVWTSGRRLPSLVESLRLLSDSHRHTSYSDWMTIGKNLKPISLHRCWHHRFFFCLMVNEHCFSSTVCMEWMMHCFVCVSLQTQSSEG